MLKNLISGNGVYTKRKILYIVFALMIVVSLLCGCETEAEKKSKAEEKNREVYFEQLIAEMNIPNDMFNEIEISPHKLEINQPFSIVRRTSKARREHTNYTVGKLDDWELLPGLEDAKIVILVDSVYDTASYSYTTGGSIYTGYSESVNLYFYDVENHSFFDKKHIKGEKLPKSAKSAPNYEIDYKTIERRVQDCLGIKHITPWVEDYILTPLLMIGISVGPGIVAGIIVGIKNKKHKS